MIFALCRHLVENEHNAQVQKKNKESTPNATLMPLLMFYLVYLEEEELKIIAKLRQNQEKNIEQTKILEVGQQGG